MVRIVKSIPLTYLYYDVIAERKLLKTFLQFKQKVAGYRRRPFQQTTKLYISEPDHLRIHCGLTDLLIAELEKEAVPYKVEGSFPILEPCRSPEFDQIIQRLQSRAYQMGTVEAIETNNGGIVHLATNAGKTEIAGATFHMYSQAKFLYLVYKVELLEQCRKRFSDVFGIDAGIIHQNRQDTDNRVAIGMVNTVYSRREELFDYLSEIDGIVVDEIQHAGGKMTSDIFRCCTNASFRLGMTGTLPKQKVDRWQVMKLFGPVVYRVRNKELIDGGFSTPVTVQVITGNWSTGVRSLIPQWITEERKAESARFRSRNPQKVTPLWQRVYQHAFLENLERNKTICHVVRDLLQKGRQGIVVFTERVEHGRILEQLSGLPFISGSSAERAERFAQLQKSEIPGVITTPILEEGVDISSLTYIIFASGGKSDIKILQRIGRALRKAEGKTEAHVIDFYDDESPMLLKHTKSRIATYTAEDFPINIKPLDKILALL